MSFKAATGAGPSLPSRIIDAYSTHTSLHDSIRPLLDVVRLQEQTQHDLYAQKGRLTSKRTTWNRIEGRFADGEAARDALHPGVGTRLGAKLVAKRRRKLEAAAALWRERYRERDELEAEIVEMEKEVRLTEERLTEIERANERLLVLEKELDTLDESLFSGPTEGCSAEDQGEHSVLVARETRRFLSAENERERRSRDKLRASLPSFESVLSHLRQALAVTLEAGVPTNTKYTRQLFVNGSPNIVARRVSTLVLSAKTASGKGTTFFAEARGSQLLVRRLPVLKLMDLNRLPVGGPTATSVAPASVAAVEPMSEASMHGSLETSYAQAQAQLAHVRREIRRSKMRSDFFREKIEALQLEERRAWLGLRQLRRDIVVGVAREGKSLEEAAVAAAARQGVALGTEEDYDDEATLAGDAEEEVRRATATIYLDDPVDDDASGGSDTTPAREQDSSKLLVPPPLGRTDSAATSNESDAGEDFSYIRNPHLRTGSTTADDGALQLLNPKAITAKSTKALRRTLRACVRDTNRKDGANSTDDLPTFWDMS